MIKTNDEILVVKFVIKITGKVLALMSFTSGFNPRWLLVTEVDISVNCNW